MKVMAVDTSNKAMAMALAEDDKLLAVKKINIKRNHSIQVMPSIANLLEEIGWQAQDLDRIAVAKGPGSYTGLRIAGTLAKTLAWTLGIDLVAYSSLEALALNLALIRQVYICPLFDARRENIYTGLYRFDPAGQLENVIEDQHLASQDWARRLSDLDEPVYFVGEDVLTFAPLFKEKLGTHFIYQRGVSQLPNVEAMALQAQSQPLQDVHHFIPEYLKLAEAEENWLKDNPDADGSTYVEKLDWPAPVLVEWFAEPSAFKRLEPPPPSDKFYQPREGLPGKSGPKSWRQGPGQLARNCL